MSKYFKKKNTDSKFSLLLPSLKSSTDSIVSIISIEASKSSTQEGNSKDDAFSNDQDNENQNSNENEDLSSSVQLFSDTPSDSNTNSEIISNRKNSIEVKEGVYQRLRSRRQHSSQTEKSSKSSSLKSNGKKKTPSSSNLSQRITSFHTDTPDTEKSLRSFSKENLLDSSFNTSHKVTNKRMKINEHINEWSLSESSEEDFLYNSGLSSGTRKAENRRYALRSFNETTERCVPVVPSLINPTVAKKKIPEKRRTVEKSSISEMCKNLQKSMQFHRKKFEKHLKYGKKQIDIPTTKMDIVMRGTGDDDYESLYLSDTEKKKLSSSSSTLPELEVETKSPPRIDVIETLSTTDSMAASEIILEHHSAPSIPEFQKLPDDEDGRSCLPLAIPLLSERAISKDLPSDETDILKIGDQLLHSKANMMQEILSEIKQHQPTEPPLNELYIILNELNCILTNYFEKA